MAGSMGYVMMNWTSELLKQAKKKNRRKLKEQHKQMEEAEAKAAAAASVATNPMVSVSCADCDLYRERITSLEEDLEELVVQQEDVRHKLGSARSALATTAERETKLREDNERLLKEAAQIRFELVELRKTVDEQISQGENDHEQQIRMLEQVLSDKETQWTAQIEALQNDLRNAINSNLETVSYAQMSRSQLEQELASLHSVIELRSAEVRSLRQASLDLGKRLERHYWLEKELGSARQRVEEMNLVVQNKMVAEKELIDMTESLTNDLSNARNEIINLRQTLENRTYLHRLQNTSQQQLQLQQNSDVIDVTSPEGKQQLAHRNEHQKARSSGGKGDPSLVLDVVEKSESVAWMLHIPEKPKLYNKH